MTNFLSRIILVLAIAINIAHGQPVRVFGHISNAPQYAEVRIYYIVDALPKAYKVVKSKLDANGKFEIIVNDASKVADAQFVCAGNHVTIFMGGETDLKIEADYANFHKSIIIGSNDPYTNQYLTAAQAQFDYDAFYKLEKKFDKINSDTAVNLINSYYSQQLDLLHNAQKSHPFTAEFILSRKRVIDFQRANLLLRYGRYVEVTSEPRVKLPSSYYRFLSDLPLASFDKYSKDPAILEQAFYFLSSYTSARLLSADGELNLKDENFKKIYQQVTIDFENSTARDQIVGELLLDRIREIPESDKKLLMEAIAYFQKNSKNKEVSQKLSKAVQGLGYSGRMKQAPNFTLKSLSGKSVSLSQFKGKVVYIDFWFSSCRPCVQEFPFTNKLKQRFAGKDVVFLYISTDRNVNLWKQTIKSLSLSGGSSVHLIDNPKNSVSALYNVNSFPSYTIINRNGQVKLLNAPRPSAEDKIIPLLQEALNEVKLESN